MKSPGQAHLTPA